MTYQAVGKSFGRIEGPEKVSGRATYTADIAQPNMIWGKALRSPFPHARIVRIDTSEAAQRPGVLAVLTAADLPDVLTGRLVYDMPVLARGRGRFIGEKVAVVAAEDAQVAEQALSYIEVEYEELPAVFEADAAMRDHAPKLHPDYRTYPHAPEKYFSDVPNVHSHVTWQLGDLDEGFAQADHIFEHQFDTTHVHQGYMEPHASVAMIDGDGRVQVWISNKMPFRTRKLLSDAIGVPEDRIVVNLIPIGGDFGGKGSLMDVTLCYHLAQRTGRPVKMVMSYTEELMAGNPRHPTTVYLRTGLKRDGRIVAREARVVFNSGAYAAFKPTPLVNISGANQAGGAYRIPHIRIDAYSVYTNGVPAGHMRSPGDPQVTFAVESAMDMIAQELGMDPVAFRQINLLQDHDMLPSGHPVEDVKIAETLEAAIQSSRWGEPKPRPTVGRGLAIAQRHIGIGDANAEVGLEADGTVSLTTTVPDTVTGAHTILRQIVAETLTVPFEQVRVQVGSTDVYEPDSGAGASRVTYVAGQAAYQVALDLKSQVCSVAADFFGCEVGEVDLIGGQCQRQNGSSSSLSLADVAAEGQRRQLNFSARLHHRVPQYPHVVTFTAQVVELEVDPETGQITLLDVVSAHDVGMVLNPLFHQSQIEGGLIQRLGFAVMEKIESEEGRVSTLSLGDYKLPTMRDIPPLRTVLVESPTGPAPFQGKAIGESSITPLAAAIANAVYDAVGVRMHELPITAEHVYLALQGE